MRVCARVLGAERGQKRGKISGRKGEERASKEKERSYTKKKSPGGK